MKEKSFIVFINIVFIGLVIFNAFEATESIRWNNVIILTFAGFLVGYTSAQEFNRRN